MQANRKMLILCCAAHFAVDFACAFLLLRVLSGEAGRSLWFLFYNFCAFALQMPLGLLVDRRGSPMKIAAVGCLLTACAYLFSAAPLLAVLLAGSGNALFHVGAGLSVLHMGKERCGPLGLFVSPGALGLYLGALLPASRGTVLLVVVLLLLAAGLIRQARPGVLPEDIPFSPALSAGGLLSAVCLFSVVCLRSLLSLSLPLPWKGEGLWGLALAFFTLLGKALGGLFADRFGVRPAALWPLALSLPLLLLCSDPLPGLLAVLLLNMTMPVTLWALARLLPGAKGFAFGILTFALFLGFLPGYLHIAPVLSPAAAAAGAGASLLFLWAGLRKTV